MLISVEMVEVVGVFQKGIDVLRGLPQLNSDMVVTKNKSSVQKEVDAGIDTEKEDRRMNLLRLVFFSKHITRLGVVSLKNDKNEYFSMYLNKLYN